MNKTDKKKDAHDSSNSSPASVNEIQDEKPKTGPKPHGFLKSTNARSISACEEYENVPAAPVYNLSNSESSTWPQKRNYLKPTHTKTDMDNLTKRWQKIGISDEASSKARSQSHTTMRRSHIPVPIPPTEQMRPTRGKKPNDWLRLRPDHEKTKPKKGEEKNPIKTDTEEYYHFPPSELWTRHGPVSHFQLPEINCPIADSIRNYNCQAPSTQPPLIQDGRPGNSAALDEHRRAMRQKHRESEREEHRLMEINKLLNDQKIEEISVNLAQDAEWGQILAGVDHETMVEIILAQKLHMQTQETESQKRNEGVKEADV